MIPYLGVFFENRGFNPQEIGFLLAILMATRIVAPNVWAKVADRTGMRSELFKLFLPRWFCVYGAEPCAVYLLLERDFGAA